MLLKSEDKGFINQASYLYFLISFGNKIKSLIKNEHIYLIEDYEIFINHNSEKISYSFNENKIINFNLDKDNKVLNLINSYFNDIVKTHEYVFLHEVGHAVQHSSITQYNPTNDKNYKPVVYYNTKTKQELYYLTPLLSNIKKPEQIAQFIYSNLQESYADIYAAYTMYLKNNTTSHINDIIQFRTQELNKIKNINSEKVTPYQNIQALNIFQQEINNNQIFKTKLKYEELHQIFQGIALKGLIYTIINECSTNKAFLNDFITFNTSKLNVDENNTTKINQIEVFLDTIYSEAKNYNGYPIMSSTDLSNFKSQTNHFTLSVSDIQKHINYTKVGNELFLNLNWEALFNNRKDLNLDIKKTLKNK